MKYSQNDEQDYITKYFGNTIGNFLEIGGYNPFTFSNTRALVELGWSGTYVEPSLSCYKSFVDEYEKSENIILLNVAIGSSDGKIKFWDSQGDALSTTNLEHKRIWQEGYNVPYVEIDVDCMSMKTLLGTFGGNCDFLNLDVERTNIELFNLIPDWFWERLKLLCIEHDGQYGHIAHTLEKFGFKEIHRNGENLILGK